MSDDREISLNEHRQQEWDRKAEDRASLRENLEIDYEASEAKAQEREQFDAPDTADVRADIAHMTGADTSTAISNFLGLDSDMRRSPAAAGEKLAEYGFSLPKRPPREKKPAPDPSDLRAVLEHNFSDDRDADAKDYDSSRNAVAELKQRFPGITEKEALTRIRDNVAGLAENPFGTATRIAHGYGLPATRSQEQRQTIAAPAEQVLTRYGMGAHTDAVAEVLERMPRTRDMMADLHRACGTVKGRLDARARR